ncbi:hypothetical protein BFT35_06025 [Thermoanaerobacterium thermosaccharolyticum]|uniref:hypothetical protein n=1 Tax=Thermoanaerobacterium thermosaccharolyticum TaxID=1517 RepID=UPI000C06ECAA|nr:hypothetical protein [Thermoanaerobacterium thermosaccharolyticum]PHO07469.1 hypothetical protein BFT35_06025 [Thermoanaerobacterium thermosaccharolyticum]
MSKWYKLVFKQLSPFHIGKYNYGVVSETELFIPGYTMWGALVNDYGLKNGGTEKIFNDVKEKFKVITCFYPYFEENNVLFPKFEHGKLYYGKYTEEELRRKLTDTFVSTAILPITRSAKDESLHETEIMLPKSKDDNKQVFWTGLIKLEDESIHKNYLLKGLEIVIGGDSRYGFGKLKLDDIQEIKKEKLAEWQIDENGCLMENGDSIRNYIEVSGVDLLKGKYRTIAELDFNKIMSNKSNDQGNGQKFTLCFAPGSYVKVNGSDKYLLNKGLFKKIE